MFVIPLVALFLAKGRDYYLAPAYPMILASGGVWTERWLHSLGASATSTARQFIWPSLVIGGVISAAVTLPVAPVNSTWWRIAEHMNCNFSYEIGWRELVETVANVRGTLSPDDQRNLEILAGDDGEAGAVNLYGPSRGLPRAISGMNSNWLRGYGGTPPRVVITVGMDRDFLYRNFSKCELAGKLANRYGVRNGAIDGYEAVFVCHDLRQPWPAFWEQFRYYG
jgi:hypothetical protein